MIQTSTDDDGKTKKERTRFDEKSEKARIGTRILNGNRFDW
jgi:hypothetical protein